MKKLSIVALMLITGSIGLFANTAEQSVENAIKTASVAIEQANNSMEKMDKIYDASIKILQIGDQSFILSLMQDMQEVEKNTILSENAIQRLIANALDLLPVTKAIVALNNIDNANEELTSRLNDLEKMGELLSELSIKAASKRTKMVELVKQVRTGFFDEEIEFHQDSNPEYDIL